MAISIVCRFADGLSGGQSLHWDRKSTKFPCHCEERSDVAIPLKFPCHCEERSDVAISWYDPPKCAAATDMVLGDSHGPCGASE